MLLIGCSGERCIVSALMTQHGKREAIPRTCREVCHGGVSRCRTAFGVTIGLHEQLKLKLTV
jgi:hypothetical protein